MDHDGTDYVSPDDELLRRLTREVLESKRGEVGLELPPFVDQPGAVYNCRVAFEDGTGDVVPETMMPIAPEAENACFALPV